MGFRWGRELHRLVVASYPAPEKSKPESAGALSRSPTRQFAPAAAANTQSWRQARSTAFAAALHLSRGQHWFVHIGTAHLQALGSTLTNCRARSSSKVEVSEQAVLQGETLVFPQ